jgi:hypothetical protein
MSESLLLTREGVRPSRIRCRFERSSTDRVTLDPFKKPLAIPGGRDVFYTAIGSQDSTDVRKKALASDAIEPRSPLFVICGRGSIDHWLTKRKAGNVRAVGALAAVRVHGPLVTAVQQRTKCGRGKANPAAIGPEATRASASVSADRSIVGSNDFSFVRQTRTRRKKADSLNRAVSW